MYRRAVTALLFMGIVAFFGLAVADGKETTAAEAMKMSGAGDQATEKFKLQAGLATWEITHDGRSNFQISLLSSDGKSTDMALNEIGRYKGTIAVRVAHDGQYLLNIKADGKWSVTIKQPRPDEVTAEKPLEARGKGPAVTRFVTLPEGLSVFKATHRGDGIFRVKLLDSEGRYIEQAVGVIGAYDGSKAIKVQQAGTYLVAVTANGDWTLKVE